MGIVSLHPHDDDQPPKTIEGEKKWDPQLRSTIAVTAMQSKPWMRDWPRQRF